MSLTPEELAALPVGTNHPEALLRNAQDFDKVVNGSAPVVNRKGDTLSPLSDLLLGDNVKLPAAQYVQVGDISLQTALDAKAAASHTHAASQISDSTATGRSVLTAADAAAARTAIGAGTSSLTIGTTDSTAKAGNYVPAWAEVTGKPSAFTPATHTHAITDVTGLQSALDAKAAAAALGDIAGANLLPDEYSTFPVLPAMIFTNIAGTRISTASPVVLGGGELLVTASGANGNVQFAAGSTIANRANITAAPGKFIVSFWCRSVEATGATHVYLYDANGTLYRGTAIAVTSTRQRYSAVVDASASPLSAFWLRLDNTGGAGTTLAFDGIMVEPQRGAITTPSPYVRGVRAIPLAGDNMLPNAGFEDWITTSGGYPASWSLLIGGSTGTGAITSREQTTTTLGGRGVRVNTTALGVSRYIELSTPVSSRAPASPGDVLTTSVFLRASAGAGSVRLFFQWRDTANAAIRTDSVTHLPVWSETDFTRLQFSAPPAPPGTVGVTVMYRVLATDTSPAWWVEYACPQLERGTVASGWRPGLASLMATPRFSAPVRSGYGGANAEMGILGTQAYVYGRNSDSPLNPITSFRWGTSATNSWTMDADGVVTGSGSQTRFSNTVVASSYIAGGMPTPGEVYISSWNNLGIVSLLQGATGAKGIACSRAAGEWDGWLIYREPGSTIARNGTFTPAAATSNEIADAAFVRGRIAEAVFASGSTPTWQLVWSGASTEVETSDFTGGALSGLYLVCSNSTYLGLSGIVAIQPSGGSFDVSNIISAYIMSGKLVCIELHMSFGYVELLRISTTLASGDTTVTQETITAIYRLV